MTGLAGFGWYQYTAAKARADETTAALIWSRLDFEGTDDPKSNATVRALWGKGRGVPAVRDAFLRQLALDRYQVDTVASAPTLIKRAFGRRPNIGDIARLVGPVLDAVRQGTTDPYQLMAVAQAVQTLGPKLSAEHAGTAIDVARTVLARTDEPSVAETFARAIAVTLPADPPRPEVLCRRHGRAAETADHRWFRDGCAVGDSAPGSPASSTAPANPPWDAKRTIAGCGPSDIPRRAGRRGTTHPRGVRSSVRDWLAAGHRTDRQRQRRIRAASSRRFTRRGLGGATAAGPDVVEALAEVPAMALEIGRLVRDARRRTRRASSIVMSAPSATACT